MQTPEVLAEGTRQAVYCGLLQTPRTSVPNASEIHNHAVAVSFIAYFLLASYVPGRVCPRQAQLCLTTTLAHGTAAALVNLMGATQQ